MNSKTQFKTLSRKDPEFLNYLEGRFSSTERALPLESLNVNSDSEMVTFRIVPVSEIERPAFLPMWLEVFKFRYFLLLAFPAFVILSKDLFDEIALDPYLILFSVLASMCLMSAANLWNDYFDHVRGLDRIHPETQKKPIQKGWVTAAATKKWALIYLVLGVLLGIPSVLVEPFILLIVAVPGGLALWAWMNPAKGFRFRRGAEFLVFLLVGPAYTMGFQLAISGLFDLETIAIGALSGWLAVFLIHLRNFEALMVNSQAGFQSTVVELGFEKSKKLLVIWWAVLWTGFVVYQYVFTPPAYWAIGSFALAVLTTVPFWRRMMALKSPVGSEMAAAVVATRNLVNVFWAWWLIQCLWLFLISEMALTNG